MSKFTALVSGKSSTGKTASLRNLRDQEGVLYLNAEAGKALPFRAKFVQHKVTNPLHVPAIFKQAEDVDTCHTIVIDSLTYLMNQYESQVVLKSSNTQQAWGQYAQYFQELLQDCTANSTKNVIFLAHTSDVTNESSGLTETRVGVKGSTMKIGVESYFNNVISTKKMKIRELEGYENEYLNITPQEEALGFKYVYQTQLTKKTVNEAIRGPMGLWEPKQTFIDNDLQVYIDVLSNYYAD